jgi:hypothetical protein
MMKLVGKRYLTVALYQSRKEKRVEGEVSEEGVKPATQ